MVSSSREIQTFLPVGLPRVSRFRRVVLSQIGLTLVSNILAKHQKVTHIYIHIHFSLWSLFTSDTSVITCADTGRDIFKCEQYVYRTILKTLTLAQVWRCPFINFFPCAQCATLQVTCFTARNAVPVLLPPNVVLVLLVNVPMHFMTLSSLSSLWKVNFHWLNKPAQLRRVSGTTPLSPTKSVMLVLLLMTVVVDIVVIDCCCKSRCDKPYSIDKIN